MSDELIAGSHGWSIDEREALARLARLIIGPDPEGVMPAVDDDALLPVILARAVDFERPIRKGLAALQNQDMVNLEDEVLGPMLDGERVLRSMLRAMMQVVAQCYYEDPRVLAILGLEPRPPFPVGHALEEGDWDLLEPVRQRGPLLP